MVRGDLTALRMALADSLTYAHSSRVHDTKAEFLDLLTRGQFIYKPIIPEARSVRVYGGAGIVTGTARMEITAHGTTPAPVFGILWCTSRRRIAGRWQRGNPGVSPNHRRSSRKTQAPLPGS